MTGEERNRGLELFLRYSMGCRHYLEDKGLITASDVRKLDSGNPPMDVLRRVFYVAVPEMEKIAERTGKHVFDVSVLREFYSGEHNERKFREGEMACLSYPARVMECRDRECLISLEPVKGRMWVDNDIGAREGDWALMHRINMVEKISERFASELSRKLEDMGLDKAYKFPRPAINYLKELKARHAGQGEQFKENPLIDKNDAAHQCPQVQGEDEAPQDKERQQEAAHKGNGEAYA